MARRFSNRPVIRGNRRVSDWFGAGLTVTTLATDDTLILSLNAAALAARPFTIVRTRLSVFYASDQTAAEEFSQAVLTMQVVSESASTAGVDSCPNGIDETDADFIVYKPLFSDVISLSSVGIVYQNGDNFINHVDSKSMRKVGTDDDVVFILAQRAARGCDIAIEGRFLVKLH